MLREVERITSSPGERDAWQQRRREMLADCVNVSDWYHELVTELVRARQSRRAERRSSNAATA